MFYKLTDKNGQDTRLCRDGTVHVYSDLLLAIMLNPIYANFKNARGWECKCWGKCLDDYGLELVYEHSTTIREILLPKVTTKQKIRFGILCAKEICTDPKWNQWADDWLRNNDRSITAADAGAEAAMRAIGTGAGWVTSGAAETAAVSAGIMAMMDNPKRIAGANVKAMAAALEFTAADAARKAKVAGPENLDLVALAKQSVA